MIGDIVGNFQLISLLGRGGMGEVYLAEQRAIGTKAAIKLLRSEISADKDQVQRFFKRGPRGSEG